MKYIQEASTSNMEVSMRYIKDDTGDDALNLKIRPHYLNFSLLAE